jgi:hypothetical protein
MPVAMSTAPGLATTPPAGNRRLVWIIVIGVIAGSLAGLILLLS